MHGHILQAAVNRKWEELIIWWYTGSMGLIGIEDGDPVADGLTEITPVG